MLSTILVSHTEGRVEVRTLNDMRRRLRSFCGLFLD